MRVWSSVTSVQDICPLTSSNEPKGDSDDSSLPSRATAMKLERTPGACPTDTRGQLLQPYLPTSLIQIPAVQTRWDRKDLSVQCPA